MLTIRPTLLEDAPLLFQWRNDESTRTNSLNTKLIEYSEHMNWLTSTSRSPYKHIYTAIYNTKPVGVVRSECVTNGDDFPIYELSWTIAPEERSKGYGKKMVQLFVAQVLSSSTSPNPQNPSNSPNILAFIKQNNIGSIKIAESIGLTKKREHNNIMAYDNYS